VPSGSANAPKPAMHINGPVTHASKYVHYASMSVDHASKHVTPTPAPMCMKIVPLSEANARKSTNIMTKGVPFTPDNTHIPPKLVISGGHNMLTFH
jgi:hypothetical protein